MDFNFKWLCGLTAISLFAIAPMASADQPKASEPNETIMPSQEPSQNVVPAPSEQGQTSEESTQQERSSSESTSEEVVPAPSTETQQQAPQAPQEEVVPTPTEPQVQPPTTSPNVVIVNPTPTPTVHRRSSLNNVQVEAGAGPSSYSETLGDALKGGTGWNVRGIIGSHTPIGMELAYMGAVNKFENINIDNQTDIGTDNSVFTNTAEALARINFLGRRSPVKPFIAGGAGYLRFDTNVNALNLDNQNTIAFPLAAGVNVYPMDNLSIGLRGDYRILTDLLDSNFTAGNQWDGILSVGANF